METASIDIRRWAVNVNSFPYNRTHHSYAKLLTLLPPEEQTRITRFHHDIDAIRALLGQLLIRCVAIDVCGSVNGEFGTATTTWDGIKVGRTEHGKPYLIPLSATHAPHPLSFNLSHHGSWVVIAASLHTPHIGVDVSKIELPPSDTVSSFFSYFSREFTPNEWKAIKGSGAGDGDEWDMLRRFYCFWCFKESYTKALGLGLGVDLQRVEFQWSEMAANERKVEPGRVEDDITVSLDKIPQPNWKIELSYLDDSHPVAICYQISGSDQDKQASCKGGATSSQTVKHVEKDERVFRILSWMDLESMIGM
ncbi:hypothetical protein HK104_004186 [Borealophlyctis nickersoniae]|nr:hypothetical protein HK104_004186 [Borealophlyctis nickersoniae]